MVSQTELRRRTPQQAVQTKELAANIKSITDARQAQELKDLAARNLAEAEYKAEVAILQRKSEDYNAATKRVLQGSASGIPLEIRNRRRVQDLIAFMIFLIILVIGVVWLFGQVVDTNCYSSNFCDYDSCSQESYKWEFTCQNSINSTECYQLLKNACYEYKQRIGVC